jgi:cytoskeleton protein RodZ
MTPLGRATAAEPPAAARSGADLRDARERLNIALEDVASRLNIRRPHLVALEEGRISLLPGNTYALGFVRTYAATLGLDPEEMVRRFRTETTALDRSTDLVFPSPIRRRNRLPAAAVAMALAMLISAGSCWYFLVHEGRTLAETLDPIPRLMESLAERAFAFVPGQSATAPQDAANETPSRGLGDGTQRGVAADAERPKDGAGDGAALSPTGSVRVGQ